MDNRIRRCRYRSLYRPRCSLTDISTDLLAATREDPRYLPILPTLFANAPNLYPYQGGADPIVPMFYDMVDLEGMYAPELRQCWHYFFCRTRAITLTVFQL